MPRRPRPSIQAMIPGVLLGLAGCGGDPMPAAPTLIGTWDLTDPTTMALLEEVTLGQGGAYLLNIYDQNAMVIDKNTGTYSITGNTVAADATSSKTQERHRVTTQYYVGQSQLAGAAFLPVGAHQKIVGTFSGSVKDETLDGMGTTTATLQFTSTFVFKADNTVVITTNTGIPPAMTSNGTWAALAAAGQYQLTVGGNSANVTLIEDTALTNQPFHRPPTD